MWSAIGLAVLIGLGFIAWRWAQAAIGTSKDCGTYRRLDMERRRMKMHGALSVAVALGLTLFELKLFKVFTRCSNEKI